MMGGEGIVESLAYGGGMGVGMGGAFLIVRWIANFIASRIDRKEDRLDKSMDTLIAHLESQINTLNGDCSELRVRVSKTEADLLECKRQHASSQAEVMQLKAQMQGYGDARQHAQLIVAAEKVADRKGGK